MNDLIDQLKDKTEKQVESAYLGLKRTYEEYPEARPIVDIFLKWYFSNKVTIICGLNGHDFPDLQKKGKYFLRGDEYTEPLQFMDRLTSFISHDLFDDGAYRIEWWEIVYEVKERKIGEKTIKVNYPVYHTDTGRFQMKPAEPFSESAEPIIVCDYNHGVQNIEELMKVLNWCDEKYDREQEKMLNFQIKMNKSA